MHATHALFYAVAVLCAVANVHADSANHGSHHRSRVHRRMGREIQRRVSSAPLDDPSVPKRIIQRRSCAPRANNETAELAQSSPSSVIISSSAAATASASIQESSSAKPSTASSSESTKASATSSAAPSATSKASTNNASSSSGTGACDLAQLFPAGQGVKQWTTCSSSDSAISLSDATLKPTNLLKQLTHNYVAAPDSVGDAMQAHYPQGSYIPSKSPRGGLSFYASGPSDVDLTTAKEATLGYRVYFPDGFQFNMGGKLPGIYGGNSASASISCSGGSRSDECMSARFMWRTDGAGEMYTYLPPSYDANNAICSIAPKSECNPTYGASVARGSFTFATGGWTTIAERVKLNDVGQENGELELFANGKSMFKVGGLVLRNSDAGRLRGIMMQTFFGGSTTAWASPKDQDVYFADFSVAITEAL